ncbi:MAG TPA: protein kinase [Planctomycetota bacterium]|nr:protein kinase [Planctomycetota bacterium]
MEGQITGETRLGEAAVKMGLIRTERLHELLELQRSLQASGLRMPLGEMMLQKGFVNPEQLAQLLKAVGLPIQPIPGYQILARIGQGGMGTVYRAKHVATQRVVALKTLTGGATQVPDYVERFFREARTAARVKHKNVVEVYDAGCTGGSYYLAMEFVPGKTVQVEVTQSGAMQETKAIEVARQIAEALVAIAKEGLVHRDIKPDNIIVTPDGTAKLCDFGIARAASVERALTQTGMVVGTPQYMSPEQIDGKPVDIRSDLYSLGCSLYFMVTARPPFDGKTLQEVITHQLTQSPPPPRRYAATLSDPLDLIVMKLLEKSPARRYRTPEDLILDLRLAQGGNKPRHARPRPRRSRSLAVAGIVGIVAAVGAATWALLPPRDRPIRDTRPTGAPVVTAAPDPRELEAQRSLADADAAFLAEQWSDALNLYRSLDSNSQATQLFGQESRRIYERMAECNRRLMVSSEEEAGRIAAVRNGLRTVRGLIDRHSWAEAVLALEKFAPNPPGIDGVDPTEEISEKLKTCRLEIEAETAWRDIEARIAREGVASLERDLEAFVWGYHETWTGQQRMPKVDQHLRKIREEAAAAEAVRSLLGLAAVAQSEAEWEKVRLAYLDVVQAHSQSEIFARVQARIEEAGRLASTALQQRLEVQARQFWSQAEDAFKRGDFEEARRICRRLIDDFAATAFVKALVDDGEITKRLNESEQRQREARDREARDLYNEAKKAMTRKKHAEALGMWERLRDEYPDLDFVKGKEREIAQQIEKCEKALSEEPGPKPGRDAEVVIDSFDGDLADWERVSPVDESKFEKNADAKVGAGAAKVTLNFKGYGRFKALPGGLPPGTRALAFWARSLGSNPVRIRVFLWYNLQGKGGAYPYAEREVGPQWQRVVIPFENFLIGTTPPGIKPEQVTRIQIAKAEGYKPQDPPTVYAIDQLVAVVGDAKAKPGPVIDRLDGDLSAWTVQGPAKIEAAKEAKVGPGAAAVSLPQGASSIERKLEGPLPRSTKAITFFAKSLGDVDVGLRLWVTYKDENNASRMAGIAFKAGREWDRIVLPIDKFMGINAGVMAPVHIRPESILSIRIMSDGNTSQKYPLNFAMDHLAAEE